MIDNIAAFDIVAATSELLGGSPDVVSAYLIGSLARDLIPTRVRALVKPSFGVFTPDGPRWDVHLARQDAAECGIAIREAEPRLRPAPVPWPVLRRSIAWVAPFIRCRCKNPALSLARVLYSCDMHRLCSKLIAGEWVMEHFDEQYAELIQLDLNSYNAGNHVRLPEEPLRALERETMAELAW